MHIVELGLQSNKLQELQKFYATALGLCAESKSAGSLTIEAGETVLHFAEAASGTEPYYHFAFNIPENRFADAKSWIKQRVPLIVVDGKDEFHFEDWQADAVYFRDPANNIVEFIARHTLKNAASQAFGPSQILNVSEIGLVVEDVHDLRVRLNNEFDLEPYFGFTDEFCAVGDEHGLFVIVQSNRLWAPDRVSEARVFPTSIRLAEHEPMEFNFHDLPYELAIA